MKESFRDDIIEQVAHYKEEELYAILALFNEKDYMKGEFFKKPFTRAKDIAFLSKGAVRVIIYKNNGAEITARIRQENSFIMDPYRLQGTGISPIGIECLEDLALLTAPIYDFQKLLESNLTLNIVVRKHMAKQLLEVGKSQYLFLTGSAKERYQFIIDNNPELLKKFPLRFIASMIGITPTQLSRLRNPK